MPIKKPGPQLGKSVGLKTAKAQMKKKGGRTLDFGLNLTPMIDMFVVLTLFLLMTFSTSGEILFIQKEIVLPKASQGTELKQAPVVIIGTGQVVIEGKSIGRIEDISEDENYEISNLSEQLNNLKRNFQQLHANQKFPADIIIQGDREITFRVLKKVMFTCTSAGYVNIHFAVLPTGRRNAPGAEGAAPAAAPAAPPAATQ